jgi:hypothetical protein
LRSRLIFSAITPVPNRYLLAKPALKAVREHHKPGVRIDDTANDVFVRFSRANPIGEIQTTLELSVSQPLCTRAFSAIPRSPKSSCLCRLVRIRIPLLGGGIGSVFLRGRAI